MVSVNTPGEATALTIQGGFSTAGHLEGRAVAALGDRRLLPYVSRDAAALVLACTPPFPVLPIPVQLPPTSAGGQTPNGWFSILQTYNTFNSKSSTQKYAAI